MLETIRKLRDITGAGIMDCKRALDEANGDLEKAAAIIREKGILKAEKKSERKTGAGLLESYIHLNRVGVLLELRAETDFAVRSEPFRALAHELALQIAALNPQNIEELLAQPYIKDESATIGDLVKQTVAKVGENIKIERFCRYEL